VDDEEQPKAEEGGRKATKMGDIDEIRDTP
jgi:hypothetical protein